ncbi:hypothetical protein RB195_010774 [Necator americanus]
MSPGSEHSEDEDVLDVFSRFDSSTRDEYILTRARDLCAHYLGGAWEHVDISKFSLSKMSGGLTNLVFRCSLAPEVPIMGIEPRTVLLRIQTGTDTLQLMKEVAIFTSLNAHGVGPKLLGIFPGGRIEEYLPSRMLSKEEMYGKFVASVAALNAQINNIEMPLPKSPQMVPLCRIWLAKYVKNGGGPIVLENTAVGGHVEFPDVLTIEQLEEEINEVERFLESQQCPSVFCHNDLVPSNVLLRDAKEKNFKKDEDRLVIIDFEFGCYNHRAYEIANNIVEHGMTYNLTTHPFYGIDIQSMEDKDFCRRFCSAYLDQLYKNYGTPSELQRHSLTGRREEDLERLIAEARRYMPLPHLFWGIWNILCVQELGVIDGIDFLTHAKDRLVMYFKFKSNLYKY